MTARIITSCDPPPIPPREFDWSAVRDGYDGGDPIGYGRTESEAIANLLEREREREIEARVAASLAADTAYLRRQRGPFVPYITPREDYMRAHPDRLPPPNRDTE